MQHVLVKWSSNWADEMDIEGFRIMKQEEWEAYKKEVRKKKYFCIYVGTNEDIEYSSGEDLLAEIKVKKITPEEERIIRKFIGSTFGNTNFLFAKENEEDAEEDSEEEL